MAAERHGSSRKRGADELPRARDQRQGQDQDQEEQEQVEAASEQQQQRDALQDQVGNHGVAAMLGIPSVKPGQAGFSNDAAEDREAGLDLQFGGDDVPPDGPLTLDDLVRSWNPTTRRGQDPTAPGDPGDPADMPPEDPDLRLRIVADPSRETLPDTLAPDALIQPSAAALLDDLGPVVRHAARCSSGSILHRAWAALLTPGAPVLSDPDGRTLFTRARVAALAQLLIVDGGALDGPDGARRAPLLFALTELAARSRAIDEAARVARAGASKLPQAAELVRQLLEGLRAGGVEPRPLPPAALRHLTGVVDDLLALPSALTLVPALSEPEVLDVDAEEDPLGLDALLDASTGGRPDPLTPVYEAALHAAEKLAGAAARLRVHGAGVVAAVGAVCAPWTSGAPASQLVQVAKDLDQQVMTALQLLVEVGRAAQRRTVPPPGIRNGLRRAARAVDQAAASLALALGPVLGGVVPPGPDLAARVDHPVGGDPLADAQADGQIAAALPWLGSMGASLERDVAVAFTRAAAGGRQGLRVDLIPLARRAQEADRPALAAAISLVAGAAALHEGADESALAGSEDLMAHAWSRRNGLLLAAAALTALEARRRTGDPEAVEAARYRAARACHRLGSGSGFTLLLRWRPEGSA